MIKINSHYRLLQSCIELLRWNKPSGRLILLIPAGWSLWLTPDPPPSTYLLALITAGGIFISGAGCIANDLWDREFDAQVGRTQNRPLAKNTVGVSTAIFLLLLMLILSVLIVANIPIESRKICFALSFIAISPIILYPSAKRWFRYPQAFLAICWGFSVLIPWAASESNLYGGFPLIFCWASTCIWTFGFDTVYAMSDKEDDIRIGLNSSAISLKENVQNIVSFSYGLTCIFLGIAAYHAGVKWFFWIIWLIGSIVMQNEIWQISQKGRKKEIYSKHFRNQVLIGILFLIGLILGRVN